MVTYSELFQLLMFLVAFAGLIIFDHQQKMTAPATVSVIF